MAIAERVDGPIPMAVARAAGKSTFRMRVTVLASLVLIAGSFAAAAALQMRLDRVHALSQAEWYETQRATNLAHLTDAALDRLADAGRAFAAGETPSAPGLMNVATFDRSGVWGAVFHGSAIAFPDLPAGWIGRAVRGNILIGTSLLAFPYRERIVLVLYNPKTMLPPSVLDRAALLSPDGKTVWSRLPAGADFVANARCANWPMLVRTTFDSDGALAAWRGTLPLYFFVILGPALAGACLSVLFVGEFERRQKASRAARALWSARPLERRLLVRLAHAEREAAESGRSKSEFIAHMSHELRTPLNAIIGFSEVIEKGLFGPTGNEKYVEYARDIANSGRGLHDKIGDILEYANIEAGRHPVYPAPFDLAEVANKCVSEHQGRAFSRRTALEISYSGPVAVRADQAATTRILTALLSNSLSYTPEGGWIRVDIFAEDFAAVLRVQDSGAGFSNDEARVATNAFARFDRAGATTGAGLGLAIAASLARRMGGALVIGGKRGEGGTTALRLPIET